MRRSDSSDNPDFDSACAPASPQQAPEREARPAAFIGPKDRPDLLSKMVDEPIRGFAEASCIEEQDERPILAQGAASKDEDKDITKEAVDVVKEDKDETDKTNFDKGGEEKTKEASDKDKEASIRTT